MKRVLCLVVALCLLASCSGGDDESGDGGSGGSGEGTEEPRPGPQGEGWTVLQFAMADTDLEDPMMDDLVEMTEVGSQAGLNIVTFVDRSAEETDRELLNIPDWSGAKTLRADEGEFTEIEELGDVNTGDPAVLTEFIATSVEENPAAHYALVISDHGASWPGVGDDGSSEGDVLDLAEINTGIADGLEQAGLEKFDLLGFDACLMASYEVASTLAPLADRMVASAELEPGHGWDYSVLNVLAEDPDASADDLGTALVDGFEAHAAENGTEQEITLSLIDLTQMEPLDEALAAFSTALGEEGAGVAQVVGTERATVLEFGKDPDPTQATHATDLGVLASSIGGDAPDLADEADALVSALGDVVVHQVAGPVTAASTGLSIYFPPAAELYDTAYDEIPAAEDWAAFLASYYGVGEEIEGGDLPAFLDAEGLAEVAFGEDGITVQGAFDPALEESLTEAYLEYGLVQEDGSILYLGREQGDLSADGSGLAQHTYDLTTLEINDGIDTVSAYVDLTIDEESGLVSIDVPMGYYSPEDIEGETYQDVVLTLVIDPEGEGLISETYYAIDPETGAAGELQAEPEGIIAPELPTLAADGTVEWNATSDVGLYADLPGLTYDFPALPSGSPLQVVLTIVDYGGNTASVAAQVPVP